MCGIAGIYGVSDRLVLEKVHGMTGLLSHRGPDGSGVHIDPHAKLALGHRRLSILDLSDAAAQPYFTKSKESLLIFNGEIYNFKELATKYGIHVESSGDTAVLAELLESQGLHVLEELNGMFAIGFYSIPERSLLLARDHAGIKPLYYSSENGVTAFASEIRSLAFYLDEPTWDKEAICEYLELGFFPQEKTVYRNVLKLRAGHYMRVSENGIIDSGQVQTRSQSSSSTQNEMNFKEKFKMVFSNSVERRLVSDKATGVFLSGGVDSSLVTAFAQEVNTTKVNTYGVAVVDGTYNESSYAEKVAHHLGTEHHTIEVSEHEIQSEVENIIDLLDEPFGDSSYIPFHLLSKYASKEITVALSGDGADELFQGYGMYQWAERLSKLKLGTQHLAFPLMKWFFSGSEKDYSKYFNYRNKRELHQNLFSQEQNNFHWSEIESLVSFRCTRIVRYDPELLQREHDSPRETQAALDYENYLVDDLLCKVDRASMYSSIEVRVPFLDIEMVEFASGLPLEQKVSGSISKVLLKEVLSDYLPHDLVYRKKWGFSIPLQKWLLNELAHLVTPLEQDDYLDLIPFIDKPMVKGLVSEFKGGKLFLYNRVWLLIQLYRWAHASKRPIHGA